MILTNYCFFHFPQKLNYDIFCSSAETLSTHIYITNKFFQSLLRINCINLNLCHISLWLMQTNQSMNSFIFPQYNFIRDNKPSCSYRLLVK